MREVRAVLAMMHPPGFEPAGHGWEARALATAPWGTLTCRSESSPIIAHPSVGAVARKPVRGRFHDWY